MMKQVDIFGLCCRDYLAGDMDAKILVHSDIADTDEIPGSFLFRSFRDMPIHEKKAMELSRGKILDIGACAGAHSLYLQGLGYDVTSIDISPGCCEVMKKRRLKNVVCGDIFKFPDGKFDTILLLMNGIGIAGSIPNLPDLLQYLRTLLAPGGKIIFDSSDLQYLYTDSEEGLRIPLNQERYYGEVVYSLQYKNQFSKEFFWLFIDPYTIEAIAAECGYQMHFVTKGPHYDYLACLY
jgi:SAM-dependent methyltransferase